MGEDMGQQRRLPTEGVMVLPLQPPTEEDMEEGGTVVVAAATGPLLLPLLAMANLSSRPELARGTDLPLAVQEGRWPTQPSLPQPPPPSGSPAT